jgi:hypothetical protein
MIDFIYFEVTGSIPFDLPFSVITFFALAGFAVKAVRGMILGRMW